MTIRYWLTALDARGEVWSEGFGDRGNAFSGEIDYDPTAARERDKLDPPGSEPFEWTWESLYGKPIDWLNEEFAKGHDNT